MPFSARWSGLHFISSHLQGTHHSHFTDVESESENIGSVQSRKVATRHAGALTANPTKPSAFFLIPRLLKGNQDTQALLEGQKCGGLSSIPVNSYVEGCQEGRSTPLHCTSALTATGPGMGGTHERLVRDAAAGSFLSCPGASAAPGRRRRTSPAPGAHT